MPVRILIVDDHELVREGLKTVLAQEPDLEVVGEAGDAQEALRAVRDLRPDVVLLDLRLPGEDGVELCRRIDQEVPGVAVVVLTTYTEPELVVEAVRAGATGYLVKDVRAAELRRAVRAVARGQAVIDPQVAPHLLRQVTSPQPEPPEPPLTPQQMTIVRLIAEGYTNREIAQRLYLSEKTVKGYVAEILHRLGVKNRVEAAMLASRQGWV